jgi:hypothetical protein
MDLKLRLSEVSVGGCFRGKKGTIGKKVEGDRIATIQKGGKVRMRAQKGDPEVEPIACSLRFIGVGMRQHPSEIVEIGSGRPSIRGVRPLHGQD